MHASILPIWQGDILKKLSLISLLIASTFAYGQTTDSVELAKRVPIADVHMHVYQTSSPSYYKEQMKKNNVQWGGGVGDYQPSLAQDLGNRYISAIGQIEFLGQVGSGLEDTSRFSQLFDTAERMFAEGTVKGFGEIHSDNHNSGPSHIHRQIRMRSPVIERMYQIADKHKGFVQIHAEYNAQFELDLYYLSQTYPNALTVLAHCLPKSNPRVLDKLFTDLPNVVCEISGKNGPVHAGLFGKARMFDKEGVRPAWASVINKHPDRIMLGTDPCCGLDSQYSEMIDNMRTMFLPYFGSEVIEKIAYKNAVRLFKLDGAK